MHSALSLNVVLWLLLTFQLCLQLVNRSPNQRCLTKVSKPLQFSYRPPLSVPLLYVDFYVHFSSLPAKCKFSVLFNTWSKLIVQGIARKIYDFSIVLKNKIKVARTTSIVVPLYLHSIFRAFNFFPTSKYPRKKTENKTEIINSSFSSSFLSLINIAWTFCLVSRRPFTLYLTQPKNFEALKILRNAPPSNILKTKSQKVNMKCCEFTCCWTFRYTLVLSLNVALN